MQPAVAESRIGYPSVAAALDAVRAKPGVHTSSQDGWTIIEDGQALTMWSFTPPSDAAHPAVVQRKVVQEGDDIFVDTNILCEGPKPACDQLTARFNDLNNKVRDRLNEKQ